MEMPIEEDHHPDPFLHEQRSFIHDQLMIDGVVYTLRMRFLRPNQLPPPPREDDVSSSEVEYPQPSDEEEMNDLPPQISNEAAASYRRAGLFPASSKAIEGLREVTAAGAREDECAVCLQDFEVDDKLRMMPCSHTFHQRCIFDWLRFSCICPLCRHALPTQQQDDRLARSSHKAGGSTG